MNARFAVAIHTLVLAQVACDHAGTEAVTSGRLAQDVGTHPVVIRRILGGLREAGLVASQPGPGGGWRLTRDLNDITLLDVYKATEAAHVLALPPHPPGDACPVGRFLPAALARVFRAAEAAMERQLAGVTVAEVMDAVVAELGGEIRGSGARSPERSEPHHPAVAPS